MRSQAVAAAAASSTTKSTSLSSMKPLHLLRGLYRQLKTPMLLSKELDKVAAPAAAVSGTTSNDDVVRYQYGRKSRSNESTRFLIHQYRMTQQQSSMPSSSSSSSSSSAHPTTTLEKARQQQQQQLQKGVQLSMELYQLRQDITARGELYLLDMGADQQLSPHELSRRAAARAGLYLPQQYDDNNTTK